jgi:hypothetical protein
MPVYILTIPGSEFTGYMAGVDFFQGKGSTSNIADAFALAQTKNCGVAVVELDGTERPVVVTKAVKEHVAPSYAAAPVVAPDPAQSITAGGVEASAPPVILSASTQAMRAEEDNPDSEWSKKRAETARAAKKHGARRRKQ